MIAIKSNPSKKPSLLAMAASMSAPQSDVMKTAAADAAKDATTPSKQESTTMDSMTHDPKKAGIPVELQRQNVKPLSADKQKKLDADLAKARAKKADAAPKAPAKPIKASKPGKPTKSGKPRAAKGAKEASGMVAECLALASTAKGADREELAKLTKWTGTPWKWMFHNSKGNGWCQRWGYDLHILTGADGETRYKTVKIADASKSKVIDDQTKAAPKAKKAAPKAKASARRKVKGAAKSKKGSKAPAKRKAA